MDKNLLEFMLTATSVKRVGCYSCKHYEEDDLPSCVMGGRCRKNDEPVMSTDWCESYDGKEHSKM